MKILIESEVKAPIAKIWHAWNNPADIMQWNTASTDWHTTLSAVDLRVGGRFKSRMEAKNGSMGFDFEGTYTRVVPHEVIEYRMSDGREVKVEFIEHSDSVLVKTAFDAETENSEAMQRAGWQAILDNFGHYVETKP